MPAPPDLPDASGAPVRVRDARPDDLGALLALERSFPGDRLSRASLRRLVASGSADVLVAEGVAGGDDASGAGTPLGDAVVLYRRGFASARLYSLAVAEAARGRGVGGALLAAAEARAEARGCVTLRLEVRADNAAALGLYRRAGYGVVGTTDDYYADGSAALRMRKRLRGPPPELRPVPYRPQSLAFTCGPACLMMALRALGCGPDELPFDLETEVQLWREATTVYMQAGHGGSSPYGLALAARRRGVAATVVAREDGVPFVDTVRDPARRAVITASHRTFVRELGAAGGRSEVRSFGADEVATAVARGRAPLLLVSGWRLYRERVPHWVVVTGADADHLYLHDPYLPGGTGRADAVHLPLPRAEFGAVTTFGRARHRYLVLLG